MNVSENGLRFILDWEGWRPHLYDDGGKRGVGNATVAIGILVHLGPYHERRGICAECDKWPRQSERDKWLTPEQGYSLLRQKVTATGVFVGGQNYEGAVQKAFGTRLNQNQFDALVDYAYNYGSGAVGRMAAAYFTNRDMQEAFLDERYLKPDWARDGLLRRRKAEYALWIKPVAIEEDDMAERVWCVELAQTWVVGKGGASPVTDPQYDKVIEAIYGPHTRTMTAAELNALRVK